MNVSELSLDDSWSLEEEEEVVQEPISSSQGATASNTTTTTTTTTTKQSLFLRAKKNIAGKAANSGVGKALFKKFADEETVTLLSVFRAMVTRYSDEKVGKAMQKNVVKIFVKVLILYEDKVLTEENFQEIYGLFRKMCSLLKNSFWNLKANNQSGSEIDDTTSQRIVQRLLEMQICLNTLLTPKLTSTSIIRMNEIFTLMATEKFVKFIFSDEDFETMVKIFAYYLNHY